MCRPRWNRRAAARGNRLRRAPGWPARSRRCSSSSYRGIAGSIDVFTGPGLRLLFTICLIASTAVAAALVRRGDLLWVVLAPPLICLALAMVNVLTTSHSATGADDGLPAHGFPAIAIAVGLAALIGGIRLLNRK